ncbi:MAG TPA: hypothetical protein DIT07_07695, partial [Sphingobacteriaceae bacterium]|nr:hypothetical protein [Sphingobacteriaceae bacterium]
MKNISPFHLKISFFLLIFLSLFQVISVAQTTTVSGTVRDATGATIPFATITFAGTPKTASSDIQGKYKVSTTEAVTQIKFTYIGYKPLIKPIVQGKEQVLNVVLEQDPTLLAAVVIKGKSKGYKNKDNPA